MAEFLFLDRTDKVVLYDKVTFEQKPEEREEISV